MEIDFVIETNRRRILVEAKAGERIAAEKLHFNRVAPLLKTSTESLSESMEFENNNPKAQLMSALSISLHETN